MENGPRNGDALLFATGEFVALLPDHHIVPVGVFDDELVGVGRAGRAQNLVKRGTRLAVRNVFGNRAVEQKRLLGHHADLRAQVAQGDAADIDPVDGETTVRDIVKARDEVDQRALTRPGLAHQADHLARLHHQVEVAQDDLARVVAKGRALKFYLALERGDALGVGMVKRLGGRIDDFKDALRASKGPHHEAVEVAKPLEWVVEHPQIGDKGHQLPQRQLAANDLLTAEIPHEKPAKTHEEVGHHEEHQPRALGADADLAQGVVALIKALGLAVLLRESLDHADTGDRLVEMRSKPRPARRPAAPEALQAIPDQA